MWGNCKLHPEIKLKGHIDTTRLGRATIKCSECEKLRNKRIQNMLSRDPTELEVALLAADSGSAGHWPTVAKVLAAEVRRLS